MQLRQKFELRKLLAPELRQSLKILTLPLLDLKNLVEEEMLNNPLLEEAPPDSAKAETTENINNLLDSLLHISHESDRPEHSSDGTDADAKRDFLQNFVSTKVSLQEALLRQLGMFADNDEELYIGHEIIGNIDNNGYLKSDPAEISAAIGLPLEKVERVLTLIQKFEPAGVGARNIEECLLIQLRMKNENDSLLQEIVCSHLDDVAKKDFKKIAKALKEPLEKITAAVTKISLLNPKPGSNFSIDGVHQVIPDITIDEDEKEELRITIHHEFIPRVIISRSYRDMLKQDNLDDNTREFIMNKLRRAQELLRAIYKRQSTLRKVVENMVEVQKEAFKEGLECLKPLTFKDISQKIDMHETTVCRVVMNKYVQTNYGVVPLKDFFPSRIRGGTEESGESVSSQKIKGLILECIEEEDKKRPLSDLDIVKIIFERKNLKVARRTIAKYREELKILSSTFRRVK